MIAFGNALESGAHHLETDLHITADGHLVCFHDDDVDRTTDGTGPVSSYTLADLRKLDAGYRHRVDGDFPFRGRGIRIPTLGEVLATFPDVGVVVDLKQDGLEGPLVEVLDKLDAWHRVIVGSFSDERLERVHRVSQGKVIRSGGMRAVRRWWATSRAGRPGPAGYAALQVPPTWGGLRVVDSRFVETAHAAGLVVHVWTVNHPDEVKTLRDLGVDAVITDRIDLVQ